jgi:hypothetical protein
MIRCPYCNFLIRDDDDKVIAKVGKSPLRQFKRKCKDCNGTWWSKVNGDFISFCKRPDGTVKVIETKEEGDE